LGGSPSRQGIDTLSIKLAFVDARALLKPLEKPCVSSYYTNRAA
jgi:hypothetical protein